MVSNNSRYKGFTRKHFVFLAGLFSFLLCVYLVADENSPLRNGSLFQSQTPQFSDREFEDLLREALIRGERGVQVKVSGCDVEVSYFYTHSCTGASGQFLPGVLQEQHFFIDLQEVQEMSFSEADSENDANFIKIKWEANIWDAVMQAKEIFDDVKDKENFATSSQEEGVAILDRATTAAFNSLEDEGIRSRRFRRVCSGHRSGTGINRGSNSLLSENPLMKSAYVELKKRQRQCRSGI